MSGDGQQQIPQAPLGWHRTWEGGPMDWLGCFGAGAFVTGLGIALACELVGRILEKDAYTPSKCLMELCEYHPIVILAVEALICYVAIIATTRRG